MSPLPDNPRRLAWRVLREWSPDGMYAEDMVDRAARRHSLSGPNRALVFAIVMAVLRHRSLLDLWIGHLRDGALDDDTRDWLRVGLAQLFVMRLAPHAAVNETVAAAGRARGLVNAVLRRALREESALATLRESAPPSVRHSLPEFLVQRWRERWGADAVEALGAWCNAPAPVYVRVNGLHARAEAAVAGLPGAVALEAHPGWYEVPEPPVALLQAGHCYAQDPSTGIAPHLLRPEPGHAVLDACAAPGGKTAILAEMTENRAILVATDQSARRLERLKDNLGRLSVSAEVMLHDWEHREAPGSLLTRFPGGFDRILLDVPCSNTGVLRRRVDVRWRLTPAYLEIVTRTQAAMLRRLLSLLRPGGRLVYSTCSIETEENAALVRAVMAERPGWRVLEDRLLLPHRDGTDGAYASLVERIPAAP